MVMMEPILDTLTQGRATEENKIPTYLARSCLALTDVYTARVDEGILVIDCRCLRDSWLIAALTWLCCGSVAEPEVHRL